MTLRENALSVARSCLQRLQAESATRGTGRPSADWYTRFSKARIEAHERLIGARSMAADIDPAAYDMLDSLAREVLTEDMLDRPAATIARLLTSVR